MNKSLITVNGRTCENAGILWLTMSGSGVSFRTMNAKHCEIFLQGDRTVDEDGDTELRAWFEIRVDGKTVLRNEMDSAEKTVTVFDEPLAGNHEVRLIKLTESTSSLLGIRDIVSDGTLLPVEMPEKKLLVIGDSITCGYGVHGNLTQQFMTSTEDATAAYGWLTAEKLGMDVQLVSFSGFGIISGYTDNGIINQKELVPTYYEKCGLNAHTFADGTHAQDVPWDFSQYEADWIVVNLGTNDLSYCLDDTGKKEWCRDEYTKFLKTVRSHDPKANILCILGVMGTGLNSYMSEAVRAYSLETGDRKIRALELDEQDQQTDGVGTNWHPSLITQKKLADRVSNEIRKWMAEV